MMIVSVCGAFFTIFKLGTCLKVFFNIFFILLVNFD